MVCEEGEWGKSDRLLQFGGGGLTSFLISYYLKIVGQKVP